MGGISAALGRKNIYVHVFWFFLYQQHWVCCFSTCRDLINGMLKTKSILLMRGDRLRNTIIWSDMQENIEITKWGGVYSGKRAALRRHSKWVRTPVEVLCSVSDKYLWERYEPTYPLSYEPNNTTNVLL